MIGILVTGPNASGKTTALQQAVAAYARDPRLVTIYADNSDRRTFKGDALEMSARLEDIWISPALAVIVEGTRMPTVLERVVMKHPARRELYGVVTVSQPEVMEAQIRGRCTLLQKRFRDDYWKHDKLLYEGTRRYRKSVPRFIPDDRISWWDMDAQYTASGAMAATIRVLVARELGEPQPAPEVVDTPISTAPGMLF